MGRPDAAPLRERSLALAVLVCVADELGIAHRDARRLTPATFDGAPAEVRGAWTALRVAGAFGGSWTEATRALAAEWDEPVPGERPMVPVGDDAILALNVRVRRQGADMSLQELARLSDITPAALADLENGRRPLVPFLEVARIAGALGLSLEALLEPVLPVEEPPAARRVGSGRAVGRPPKVPRRTTATTKERLS